MFTDESVIGNEEAALFTLPSKKWHWRARTAALYFYQKIPQTHDFKVRLICSRIIKKKNISDMANN